MKKSLCLLLTVMLLCLQSAASAEHGYELLRTVLTYSTEDHVIVELDEDAAPSTVTNVTMLFLFWRDVNNICLMGRNEDSLPEATFCTMDETMFFATLNSICASWDTVTGQLDEGYELVLILQAEDSGDVAAIKSAEEAAIVYKYFTQSHEEEAS